MHGSINKGIAILRILITAFIFYGGGITASQAQSDDFLPATPEPASNSDTRTGTTDENIPIRQSLAYYDRCLATLYQDYPDKVRQPFCACTAEKARENLSPAELALLAGDGRGLDDTRIKIDITGPCLGIIIRRYEYDRFASSTNFRDFFRSDKSFAAAAHCIGDGMALLFDEYGRDAMAQVQREREKYEKGDPLDDYLSSALYKKELGKIRNDCMNKYAFK